MMIDSENPAPALKPDPEPSAPLVDAQHPWLGLLPFREEHTPFFFGRDAETAEIVDRIQENSLTVLYGQSGLGKTSLLLAGVLPQLRKTGFSPVHLRLDHGSAAPSPVEQTRTAFRTALKNVVGFKWPEDADAKSMAMWKMLANAVDVEWPAGADGGCIPLWELFHRYPTLLPLTSPVPVLIFDQFEEIFSLGQQDEETKRRSDDWLTQIADLLQNRPPKSLEARFTSNRKLARDYDFGRAPLRMVFALREDYLSHLESWKETLPLLTQNRMSLFLFDGPQALEAVLGPGSIGRKPLVSSDVASTIIRTVARVPEDTPLSRIKAVPPLLSLLCERLNNMRLESGQPKIGATMVSGSSDDILQEFYDESFDHFPEDHRETVRKVVEDRMVTVGGHRSPIAREDAEAELTAGGVPENLAHSTFDFLVQRRLLTAENHGNIQRLEITHDVLVPLALRARKERHERGQKEEALAQLREEKEKSHRRKVLTATMGATLALVLGCTIYGVAFAREIVAQSRYNEGLGWMLRAEVAEERHQYPEALLYAAQAIGFEGVGRPYNARENFTRFIRKERNPDSFEAAQNWIAERPAYLPIWASANLQSAATGLSVSPDGRWLALGSADGSVYLWDFRNDAKTVVVPQSGPFLVPVNDVAFHPSGKVLAIATEKSIRLWDIKRATFTEEYAGFTARLAWSPGGSILTAASADGGINLWREGKQTSISTDQNSAASSLSFSADNSVLAAAFPGGLRLVFPHVAELAGAWSEKTPIPDETMEREKRVSLAGQANAVTAVAMGPDGIVLAAGDADGAVSLWDVAEAKLLGQASAEQCHQNRVLSLCFRHDGLQIASASSDGTIRLWKISGEKVPVLTATLTGYLGEVVTVEYAPGGDILASAGADGSAKLWNVSGKKVSELYSYSSYPDLFSYIDRNWYSFDPMLKSKNGTGFANVPADTVIGRWEAGGGSVFDLLLDSEDWNGAAIVADPAKQWPVAKTTRWAVPLWADALDAAKHHRWHRVDLRLGQLQILEASPAASASIAELLRQRNAFGQEGQPFTNTTGLSLLWCTAGTFTRGGPKGQPTLSSDKEQQKVILSHGFWLSQYEVTQEQWVDVMGNNPSSYKSSGDKAPVESITWFEAIDFCRRLTDRERARGSIPKGWKYALPTEAQLEYACRAGTSTAYSFGDDPMELYQHGNYSDISGDLSNFDKEHNDGVRNTAPVGAFLPNPWGFYDMHGNVWEWCVDSVNSTGQTRSAAETQDPIGLAGPSRIYRGGAFLNPASECRAASSKWDEPAYRSSGLGLRPALISVNTTSPKRSP
ncbi:MAG: formylglycine-generating enzyme required for sulfatase activity/WD40 repeat protein [Verrucomicrobiales bacterium]|jgi:formylglycine-generating enzyme required for sulfatase activity/WD40 repeat protein